MEKERKSGSVDWRSILAKYLLSLIYFFKGGQPQDMGDRNLYDQYLEKGMRRGAVLHHASFLEEVPSRFELLYTVLQTAT